MMLLLLLLGVILRWCSAEHVQHTGESLKGSKAETSYDMIQICCALSTTIYCRLQCILVKTAKCKPVVISAALPPGRYCCCTRYVHQKKQTFLSFMTTIPLSLPAPPRKQIAAPRPQPTSTTLQGKQVDTPVEPEARLPMRALTAPDVVCLRLKLGVSFPLGRGDAGGSSDHNSRRDYWRRGAAALP